MNKTEIRKLAKEMKTLLMTIPSDYEFSDVLNELNYDNPIKQKWRFFKEVLANYDTDNKIMLELVAKDPFWKPIANGTYLTFQIHGKIGFSMIFATQWKRPWVTSN